MDPARLKPRLLVVCEHGRSIVERLFAARGFVVVGSPAELAHTVSPPPELVVLDFASPHAARLLVHFAGLDDKPVLVGIDAVGDAAEFLDAAFVRPVDPARLFVRAVVLLGQRRDPRRGKAIPGVVGVVHGNELFERIKAVVSGHVSALNAGAVLEDVIKALGSTPAEVSAVEIEAAIASGRLRTAVRAFLREGRVDQVLAEIQAVARG